MGPMAMERVDTWRDFIIVYPLQNLLLSRRLCCRIKSLDPDPHQISQLYVPKNRVSNKQNIKKYQTETGLFPVLSALESSTSFRELPIIYLLILVTFSEA
jgi:hypothetical protein